MTEPPDRRTVSHMLRQKSSLGVLHAERDWIHVSNPGQYAFEMAMKETLLLAHPELTYVSTPQSVAAEQEVMQPRWGQPTEGVSTSTVPPHD